MTAPLDARLAEVEEFLDVWDAAPAHRTRYRDVISSQKSGDPEGGRKLRATALRELVAEVRRLTAENEQLADLDAATSRRSELQAERDRAVTRWHEEHQRAERLAAEVDRFHAALANNRLAHTLATVRMIVTESTTGDADLLRRVILEQLAALDAGSTQDGLQRLQDASRPAPATSEPSEALESPQRATGDLRTPAEWCRVYGMRIVDPDGWRDRHAEMGTWGHPISLAEFQRRASVSTVDAPAGVWKRINDDLTPRAAQPDVTP